MTKVKEVSKELAKTKYLGYTIIIEDISYPSESYQAIMGTIKKDKHIVNDSYKGNSVDLVMTVCKNWCDRQND